MPHPMFVWAEKETCTGGDEVESRFRGQVGKKETCQAKVVLLEPKASCGTVSSLLCRSKQAHRCKGSGDHSNLVSWRGERETWS